MVYLSRFCLATLTLLFALPAARANAGVNRWTQGTPDWGPTQVRSLAASWQSWHLYAAAQSGVFTSLDGGRSWILHDLGLNYDLDPVSVTIDPQNPLVAYLVTWRRGLLETVDGGRTWLPIGGGFPSPVSGSVFLAVDPKDSDTVYAGYDGVYKSGNGGQSWRRVSYGSVRTITIDPRDSRVVYAADAELGLIKSSDGGEHWAATSAGLPSRPFVWVIVIDPSNPATIYVVASDAVYRSLDRAGDWEPLVGFPALAPVTLSIDPLVPARLYATGFDTHGVTQIVRSTDGGQTWTTSLPDAAGGIKAISASSVEGGTAVAAGLLLWTTRDAGQSWTSSGAAAIGAVSLHVGHGTGTLLAAGGTQRLSRSEDGGRSWSPANDGLFAEPILSIQEDVSGTRLFAASASALCESDDDGKSWRSCFRFAETTLSIFRVVVDPYDPQTVYASSGGYCGRAGCAGSVLASTDAGAHWQSLADIIGPPLFNRLYLSPGGETLYAITYQIWKGNITAGLQPIQWPLGDISDLAIDPTNPLILYAFPFLDDTQFRGPISRSEDRGSSWVRLSDGPATTAPESAVLIDPTTPARMYLATFGGGVFETTDAGVTWSPLSGGLTELAVRSLGLSPDGKTLYAGTDHAVYQYTFCDGCPPRVERSLPPTRIVSPRFPRTP